MKSLLYLFTWKIVRNRTGQVPPVPCFDAAVERATLSDSQRGKRARDLSSVDGTRGLTLARSHHASAGSPHGRDETTWTP